MIGAALLFLKGVPAWVWQLLAVLALLAGIYGYGHHRGVESQKAATEAVRKEYGQFVANVKAQGEAATKRAKEIESSDIERKKVADAKYKETVVYLSDELDSLRRANPRGNTIPQAPAASRNSSLACFDRAELNSAVDGLLADLQGQARQGAEATAGLNVIRAWANNKSAP